ncbi:hypothetical protein SLA2020_415530 [Shorea laevis]
MDTLIIIRWKFSLLLLAAFILADDDSQAMSKLADALNPRPHNRSTNVSNAAYCHGWEGVVCDRNNQTKKLFPQSKSLNGSFPFELLCPFSDLRVLTLRNNSFTGSLPNSLACLTSLKNISLADNNFSSILPEFF